MFLKKICLNLICHLPVVPTFYILYDSYVQLIVLSLEMSFWWTSLQPTALLPFNHLWYFSWILWEADAFTDFKGITIQILNPQDHRLI